jgi:predicted nucleic acid-binding protein
MASAGPAVGLVDTDVLVDAQRNLAAAVKFLGVQRQAGGVQISIVTAMELVVGCRHNLDLTMVQKFLQQTLVLPLNEQVSRTAYGLMESFFLSHGLLIPDALIAATALEQKLALYTRNVRHFQMIPGLIVVPPY